MDRERIDPDEARRQLLRAVHGGDLWAVERLAGMVESIEAPLLIHAAYCNQIDIARVLLSHGALVDGVDENDSTPLMYAVGEGYIDMVRLLLKHGADVEVVDDMWTPLMLAASKGYTDIARVLLSHGADPNAPKGWMWPISMAQSRLHLEIVRLLVDYGAVLNASTTGGMTPLMEAVTIGDSGELIQLLVELGVDVNVTNPSGSTALMWAVQFPEADMARFLLEHGADANVVCRLGHTAMSLAKLRGREETVRLLERYSNGSAADEVAGNEYSDLPVDHEDDTAASLADFSLLEPPFPNKRPRFR